jgi:arylsulfatase A-like enzyme
LRKALSEVVVDDTIDRGADLRDEPRIGHAVKVHCQEYYALTTRLDAQIGRILDALEKRDMLVTRTALELHVVYA